MSDYFRQNAIRTTNFSDGKSWVILSAMETRLKQKIEANGIILKDWNVQINRGILTGYNEAFIIDDKTKDALIEKSPKNAEIIRPILKGRNIKKYRAEFGDLWLINSHNGIKKRNIPRINIEIDYPIIFNHLSLYKAQLEKRLDQGDSWTNLRNCAYLDEFEKEKIIWLELTDLPKFAFDDKKTIVEATAFIMTGDSLKYLVSYLNSKLCEWYFDKITITSGVGTNRWKKIYIEELPIPKLSLIEEARFSKYVDEVLFLKSENKSTSEIENKIDNEVYKLFDLTNEEIYIIQNSSIPSK